ncbi:hypothetical protein JTE90_008694 [Oedothorax gibbosus]|uniref:Uncharacterized protein n=1 Tax=Oedothorax gibbosus TaxID=931172 RepID=A0AAV6V2Z3_9ARAC|nr:hypothetical protein JTE90_008694 [Oedothorax gibbosus]
MASKLLSFQEQGNEFEEIDSEKRTIKANIPLEEIHLFFNTQLDHFITPSSLYFFKRFKLSTDFLKSDPSMWEQDLSFLKGKNIVRNLRVVNDTAERGVKLIQYYSDTIRKDEKQKQYLLQIISECRKIYPDVTKSTLEKSLPST